MKIDRLLAITMLLVNRKRISARELAEHFEVSVRTIHRDIEAINQSGIPVISYQGASGGFGIMENFKVDKNVLTPDNIIAIITALKGISTAMDDRKIHDTLEKMKGLISGYSAADPDKFKEQVVIDFNPWGANVQDKEKLGVLKEAVGENRLIRFFYTNSKGESGERDVEPMGLVFRGASWYLYGYCRVREEYRMFRLSRMKSVRLLSEYFKHRGKSLEEFTRESGWSGDVKYVNLKLHFSPSVRVRVEDSFAAEQIQVNEDGSSTVCVTFPEDNWVYGMILSYADDVEVLEPQYLRAIIKEKGRKIWELYK